MGVHPPYPSFASPDLVDDFFIKGRKTWPDLEELSSLKVDRSVVPDRVVRFIRSTALNEHGVAHYLGGYLHYYGGDYKLRFWSAMWTAEEYTHYIVLRRMLQALGEDLTEEDFAGLEAGDYQENYTAYLDRMRIAPEMDQRMEQLIFGVTQEYSAVIAYTAAADHCNEPQLAALFKRIAKDEMRHCRFNQVALEEMVKHCSDAERALIWPQFRVIWEDFQMPTEHIAYFTEMDMGTELYTSLWDGEARSRMVLYLTRYFSQYRKYVQAEEQQARA